MDKEKRLPLKVKQNCVFLLECLPDIGQHIRERKRSLLSRTGPEDENIGGGSSGRVGQPTEQKAILLVSDPYIIELEKADRVFNTIMSDYPTEKKNAVEGLYFFQERKHKVAKDLGVSVRTLERWNKEFMILFASEMGYLEGDSAGSNE